MDKPLTARERSDLKARAHALEPRVQVGGAGVTDALIAEVDRALTAHELIKVKIPVDDRAARNAIADEVCARVGAAADESDSSRRARPRLYLKPHAIVLIV